MENTAKSIYQQQETRLTVAADDGLLLPQVFDVLKQVEQQFPSVELELLSLPSTDIAQEVAAGKLDLGMMFSEIEAIKPIDFCYVGNIEYVAVCHPQSVLAALHSISLTELLPHRQIAVRGRAQRESQLLLSIASKTWWCSSYSKVLALVNRNVGWAYLPRFMVAAQLTNGQLHALPVSFDHVSWSVPVDLVFRRGAQHGPVVSFFIEQLKRLYSTI